MAFIFSLLDLLFFYVFPLTPTPPGLDLSQDIFALSLDSGILLSSLLVIFQNSNDKKSHSKH